jgi:hypothetical protein
VGGKPPIPSAARPTPAGAGGRNGAAKPGGIGAGNADLAAMVRYCCSLSLKRCWSDLNFYRSWRNARRRSPRASSERCWAYGVTSPLSNYFSVQRTAARCLCIRYKQNECMGIGWNGARAALRYVTWYI